MNIPEKSDSPLGEKFLLKHTYMHIHATALDSLWIPLDLGDFNKLSEDRGEAVRQTDRQTSTSAGLMLCEIF